MPFSIDQIVPWAAAEMRPNIRRCSLWTRRTSAAVSWVAATAIAYAGTREGPALRRSSGKQSDSRGSPP